MQNEDEKSRAQLATLRLELARELERFGVVTPTAGASAEQWDRFLVDARQARRQALVVEKPASVELLLQAVGNP